MTVATQRKLAAIVSADVAGFSRLMGADEEGTLAALKAHRNAVDPVIFSHGGSIVKATGDGMLVEFPTIVAAVQCCMKAQRIMAERDATLPDARRMRFRIGVHLGEVMVDDGDIFGDVVNIAARLQEMAEPGGVALSAAARDAVHRHIDAAMIELGPQSLKNIAEPVTVWRVDMGDTQQRFAHGVRNERRCGSLFLGRQPQSGQDDCYENEEWQAQIEQYGSIGQEQDRARNRTKVLYGHAAYGTGRNLERIDTRIVALCDENKLAHLPFDPNNSVDGG